MNTKAETTRHSLYGGEIQIDFRENPYHTYKLVGEKLALTSVTSVTGLIDKSRVLIQWAIGLAGDHLNAFIAERGDMIDTKELKEKIAEALKQHQVKKDEAASNGSLVHAWAEAYAKSIMGGSGMPSIGEDLPDQVVAGINGFLDFVNAHKVKFLEVERLVYSRTHGYAGLFDAIIEIDGVKCLVDWKTSKSVYDEMYLQISAYVAAYAEETGEQPEAKIIHFNKETGEFTIHPVSREDLAKDFDAFVGLLEAKNRLKERARVQG